MAKSLQKGDRVYCRLYNAVDNKFYGDFFTGTITRIALTHYARTAKSANTMIGYLVHREHDSYALWLHRKEIIRRIK